MTATEIIEAIKNARRSHDLTQRQLASLARVSHSYVSHVEAGRRMPSLDTVMRIAAVLGLRLTMEDAR